MKNLKNGNRVSDIKVSPANWKTKQADINKEWFIYYRFYPYNKPASLIKIRKGINTLKTLKERQSFVKFMIEQESRLLDSEYNPIDGKVENSKNISPMTGFSNALNFAIDKKHWSDHTKTDYINQLAHINNIAEKLNFSFIPICEIKKSHLKVILEECQKVYKWTANNYNKHRSILVTLYNELMEYDVVDINLPLALKTQIVDRKIRTVLNAKERIILKNHLIDNYPRFWLFINMFFHSGTRVR